MPSRFKELWNRTTCIIWKVERIGSLPFSLPSMRCPEELQKEKPLDRPVYHKMRKERGELVEYGRLAITVSRTISADVFKK